MTTSSKKINETIVNFKLVGIELLEASLNHPKSAMPEQRQFHFELKLEHKFNSEKQLFIVVIYVEIFNEQKDIKFGSLTSSCIFEIENLKDYIDPKNNKINLSNEFFNTINSIAISTIRGIMFSQFKGTFLHNAYLPIIDPKSFVSQK
jgi:hypothetical protein